MGKLAKSKERTTRQLQGMKRDLHHTETEAKEEKAKTSSSMTQLMVELNSVKEALQETRSREKQVRIINQVLDEVYVICRIIYVEAITVTETLIILHITKTESNNCFIIHFKRKTQKTRCHNMKLTENIENVYSFVLLLRQRIPHTVRICIVGSTCR